VISSTEIMLDIASKASAMMEIVKADLIHFFQRRKSAITHNIVQIIITSKCISKMRLSSFSIGNNRNAILNQMKMPNDGKIALIMIVAFFN